MLDAAANVLFAQTLSRAQNDGEATMTLRIVQRGETYTVVQAEGGGFALVSNDDRLRPVLGYSPGGRFDAADLPCGMRWYLESLDQRSRLRLSESRVEQVPTLPSMSRLDQRSRLKNVGADGYEWTPVGIKPSDDVKPQVEPMLQTDWYQHTPFNDWCPTYVDGNGMVNHHVVGCGCTAVSQVMYYHRHPEVGRGETTYEYDPKQVFYETEPVAENMVSLSCRFDTVRFDWNSMAAQYYNRRSSDEAANAAVARLCMAVGIAMKMEYTETSGSGSGMDDAARALRDHFGYGIDTRYLVRSQYADAIWMDMVFEELSNGRPIVYGGKPGPNRVGHFFVLDGYDTDGLVHINWGWGDNARYDGYFELNYPCANTTSHHFSEFQTMVVRVRPEDVPLEMKELTVATPGTLADMLPADRSLRLKVKGLLDVSDLQALRQLGCGMKDADGRITAELTHLDLSEATVPDDILPESAFESCTALLDVVLPSSLKGIGDRAFLNCSRLYHAGMPSGLHEIGTFAFQNCTSLTDIVIPRDVETIGNGAFSACIANEAFAVEAGNRCFATIEGLLTNAARNKLVCFPAKRTEAYIPATIDSIGPFAFRYCIGLTQVHIPGTVKTLEKYAFMSCLNLAAVTIDEGVQSILGGAFNKCSTLTEVHLPASLQTIGENIFINCAALHHVDISEASLFFRTEDNLLYSKDGTQLVQQLTDDKEELVVPSTVTVIAAGCFRYLNNLRRLTIPASVASIGNYVIYGTKGLTDVTSLAVNPIALGNYVFYNEEIGQATLHVPTSSQKDYQTATGWMKFGTVSADQPSPIKVVVAPLLSSKWHADTPYNGQVPVCSNGQHCVVGCGALSMAQVMRYWQWPDRGVGQNTYTCKLDSDPSTPVELSVDFGQTTYQWDKMLDTYAADATDEERQAVAQLCYHAGVALDMDFGYGGSPNSKTQVTALNRHFRYYAKRMFDKSDEEYAEVMRNELDAGRPVIFHGENESSTRAHTFVCDGYAEDGYFHFCFGYLGKNNGYYRLSELLLPDGTDFRFHHRIHAYNLRPYRGEMPTGTVELTVEEPGTLQQLVDQSAAPFTTSLKVTGPLNGADLLTLRRLLGRDERNNYTGHILTDLDLGDACFVPSDDVYWQYTADGVTYRYRITRADEVPENSFRNTNLRRIVLPSSARTIRKAALYACLSLEELDFGSGITLIDTSAVLYTGLREIVIPEQVKVIRPWAFGDNKQLKRLHIPAGITTIGYCAFNRCDAIEEVTCLIPQPFYVPSNLFSATDFSQAILRVPAGTDPLYRRTQYWRNFAHIEELENEALPLPYLVMSSWKAGDPFNGDSPLYNGQHLAVGCGTVATAQILGHYRNLTHGFGQAKYVSSCEGIITDVDVDFEAHPFDWDNILDVYGENATDEQKDAVANLINMVSAAIQTQYGSTYGTIVNYGSWLAGMTRFLHFAPSARYRQRKYYSTAEWTRMIDEQLSNGHPVIYNSRHTQPFGGNSSHIFILDGRNDDGNYHFNFGYDNSNIDKFTSLSAINQGNEPKAGNSFTCWHHRQAMITDCYPVEGLTENDYPRCEASLSQPFVLEDDASAREVKVSNRLRAKFQYRCISFNTDSLQYTLGFFHDGMLAGVSPSWRQNRISIGGGGINVDRYFVLPEELADGDYEMALVTRTDADSPWLRSWDNVPNRVPVIVSGGTFSFRLPDLHDGPTILRLQGKPQEIEGVREGGHTFEFTIHNPSENNFEDSLRVSIVTTSGNVYSSAMPTSVYDGQTLSYRYFIPDDKADFGSGYTVELYYRETCLDEWIPLTGNVADTAFDLSLSKGWNWVSVPLSDGAGSLDVRSFLQPIEEHVERMQSQRQELVNDEQWGMVGNLSVLKPQEGYRMMMSDDVAYQCKGWGCAPQLFPVTLQQGWNWIGYVSSVAMLLDDVLATATPSENDCIEGHDEFAVYSNGKWSGSLTHLRPGNSYLYHASRPTMFRYLANNVCSRGNVVPFEAEAGIQEPQLPLSWSYDVHAYPDVTTVIAQLHTPHPADFAVAAFCDGECRGVGKVVGELLFLTVHGSLGSSETITLQAYENDANRVWHIAEQFRFDGERRGTMEQPIVLTLCDGITDIDQIATERERKAAFTLDGRVIRRHANNAPISHGVYIVREKNGRWRKALVP